MYNVFPLNQNLCAKKPCLNNGKCYMGYTEKKYVCVCPAGYQGENCEKGKQYIDNYSTLLFMTKLFKTKQLCKLSKFEQK